MAEAILVPGVWTFKDGIAVQKYVYLPNEVINDDHISTNINKRIQATKLVHQYDQPRELYAPATAIAAITADLASPYADASLIAFRAWFEVVADDVTRLANIDLKKSTAGGAYATILSAPIQITTSSVVRVPIAATIANAALLANDLLQVVVTVSGAGGTTHAKGLCVSATIRANPA